jgi:hypothetical protein
MVGDPHPDDEQRGHDREADQRPRHTDDPTDARGQRRHREDHTGQREATHRKAQLPWLPRSQQRCREHPDDRPRSDEEGQSVLEDDGCDRIAADERLCLADGADVRARAEPDDAQEAAGQRLVDPRGDDRQPEQGQQRHHRQPEARLKRRQRSAHPEVLAGGDHGPPADDAECQQRREERVSAGDVARRGESDEHEHHDDGHRGDHGDDPAEVGAADTDVGDTLEEDRDRDDPEQQDTRRPHPEVQHDRHPGECPQPHHGEQLVPPWLQHRIHIEVYTVRHAQAEHQPPQGQQHEQRLDDVVVGEPHQPASQEGPRQDDDRHRADGPPPQLTADQVRGDRHQRTEDRRGDQQSDGHLLVGGAAQPDHERCRRDELVVQRPEL